MKTSVPGFLVVVAILASGCSSSDGTDNAPGGSGGAGGTGGQVDASASCIPGQSSACVAPGGCQGGQVCNPDGRSYAACVCAVVTDSGAGGAGGSGGLTAGAGGASGQGGAGGNGGTGGTGGVGASGGSGGSDASVGGSGGVAGNGGTAGSTAGTGGSGGSDASVGGSAGTADGGTVCKSGQLSCRGTPAHLLERCNSTGSGWDLVDVCATPALCQDGLAADAGTCATVDGGTVCNAGQLSCRGTPAHLLEQCNSTGSGWGLVDVCATPALCQDGLASDAGTCATALCAVGQKQCSGAILQICNASRNGWDDASTCLTTQLCQDGLNGDAGACANPACDVGELKCGTDRKTLYTCNGGRNGWGSPLTCSGTTPFCKAGACSRYPSSCKAWKALDPIVPDGVYTIDPDNSGAGPFDVNCDMSRDGGGFTLAVKAFYCDSAHGVAAAVGSVGDGLTHMGPSFKLSDNQIRALIGPSQHFDVLMDQSGYNNTYSSGNYEYVVLRNYTAYWKFDGPVAESTTTTTMQSYRASDGALAWTGRLLCGASNSGGSDGCANGHNYSAGINCYGVAAESVNPAGGTGCTISMGTQANSGWHMFVMGEQNSDTYLYICNGAQHSSSHDMNHRVWIR
jgi:hypothetical protein